MAGEEAAGTAEMEAMPGEEPAGAVEMEAMPGRRSPGSAPAAVSWGPNRIDVSALGRDRAMWHA